jgi:LysM repeat protein
MTMNNQSPLIPQGSLQEQRNKGRARVKIAVFLVLAIHGVGLMALLMQGCKKDADAGGAGAATESTNTASPAFVAPTNAAPVTNIVENSTNAPPPVAMEQPQPVPTPPAVGTDYVIVKGDTFSTIHQKFHVSIKALQDANPSVEPTKLKIGQTIHIPAPTLAAAVTPTGGSASNLTGDAAGNGQPYTVKSGDSLTKIAGEFGVTVKALRSFNSLKTDKIVVGQKLKIPAKTSVATSAPAATGSPAPTGASGQ